MGEDGNRMIDREALAAALDVVSMARNQTETVQRVIAAARERLAQMPEKCPACALIARAAVLLPVTGLQAMADDRSPCLMCHGRGALYPPALENAAQALQDWDDDGGADWWSRMDPKYENERNYYRNGVVTVLDALNTETL